MMQNSFQINWSQSKSQGSLIMSSWIWSALNTIQEMTLRSLKFTKS